MIAPRWDNLQFILFIYPSFPFVSGVLGATLVIDLSAPRAHVSLRTLTSLVPPASGNCHRSGLLSSKRSLLWMDSPYSYENTSRDIHLPAKAKQLYLGISTVLYDTCICICVRMQVKVNTCDNVIHLIMRYIIYILYYIPPIKHGPQTKQTQHWCFMLEESLKGITERRIGDVSFLKLNGGW
jgi:hypothetical protein